MDDKKRNHLTEIIVDNFAGGGGASTGIEMAIGRSVDIAINHDPDAIAMHKVNHPKTKHYCEDVWQVDPKEACAGHPVALAWFSPDCKHFSRAKGGKPVDKNIRGLAWVTLRWAATVQPRVIMLENVPEIQSWGPIDRDGKPIKEKAGCFFCSFIKQLKQLGYRVEYKELKSCDYGAPTTRKRFYLIARCDGKPVIWPEPTHADRRSKAVKDGLLLPYRTAAECIDWSILTQSIFDRKRPLADNTMKRIARGIIKYVIENPEPFIVTVNHGSDSFRGQGIHEPLNTVTAKNGYGIIAPVMTAIGQTGFSDDRSYSIDEPIRTIVSKNEQLLVAPTLIQYHNETTENEVRGQEVKEPIMTVDTSNRYALASAFIAKNYSGGYTGAGSGAEEPMHTITAKDHNSLVAAHVMTLRNHMDGQNMNEPLGTITASGAHHANVLAFLAKYYGEGSFGQSVDEPLHTITTKDRFGLVTIFGEDYIITDIHMRMLQPHELFAAMGFPSGYVIDRDSQGKPYPKSKQVARCGNAVTPPVPEALVKANLPELCHRDLDESEQLTRKIADDN